MTAAATSTPRPPQTSEVTVISHSALFYWWPVWAVGFLMAGLTYLDRHYLAVVPEGTKGVEHADVRQELQLPGGEKRTYDVKGRDVLVLPDKAELPRQDKDNPASPPQELKLHMAASKNYGVLFASVLLLVIFITNVSLRGMWSVVVIITIVLLSIIFALAGWWEPILARLYLLDIRINAGGYLLISGVLFGLWLIILLLFDRQRYIIFTAGQFKVCEGIGGGEKVYDATGMTVEKQRSDLFRHWILGLGSGDLVVRTHGALTHDFDLPNVLFVSRKVAAIEKLLKEKMIVQTPR
jgi:hypothetical protein